MQVGDMVVFKMPDGSSIRGYITFISSTQEYIMTTLEPDANGLEIVVGCSPTVMPFAPMTYKRQLEEILDQANVAL